ncbi:Coq4 family protein [Altererythrobacter sp. MF3-039]|uniref:Coq4 family protein n=1 Tax=Altererythrobacter sp. MF3-039 TaxID=3252901 RepID=UPI00390C4DFC
MTDASVISTDSKGVECAADGTPLRHPDRAIPKYEPLKAWHHFRILLKDKEDTAEVFKIFEALPHKTFMPRVRDLTLSEQGEKLRSSEAELPSILDDHESLRKLPEGTVAHAYCDFMEREGLTAAGLVAESEAAGRPIYPDLIQWYGFRLRDTHDLMHVLTGYGRDALGEQCVLLFTHGQNPSHGHLLLGYAGSFHMKKTVKSGAPVFKAVRQAHKTGVACPSIVGMSIRELLAMDLAEARKMLNIPEPTWYHECHRVWRSEGIDPYDLLAERKEAEQLAAA